MNGDVSYRRYDRDMTGSPYGVPQGGQWPPPEGQPQSNSRLKPLRVPLVVAVVVGLIGIAVGAISWFRPFGTNNQHHDVSSGASSFTESEIAEAERNLCNAHSRVSDATELAGSQTGDDQLTKFVAGLGIRIAASLGADYLFRKLDENPAAPQELANQIYELAGAYQDLVLLQIADASAQELEPYYQRIDELDPAIVKACP